jgi:hypothetical protein
VSSRTGAAPHRAARQAAVAALVATGVGLVALASCAGPGPTTSATTGAATGAEHGLVLTRSAGGYLLVMDILAPEPMYTSGDVASMHPADGELVVRGMAAAVDGEHTRHVEIHVYDLRDGEPVRDPTPTLTFVDHTSGRTQALDATLMHDLALGESDDHFGTNASFPTGHRFTVRVGFDGTTTDFTGTLP